jgi:2-oxoglutarate dehydrogenase complex dehydrogenase (E1) component-like enzyme
MAIRTSELTKLIAEQVTKDVAKKLIPKLRRVVREEIDRSMKDMIYEMVVKQQTPLQDVVRENTVEFAQDQPENVSAAKTFIAQRQASRSKAQQLIEKNFKNDDPFADLIMNAEDPQEALDLKEQQILNQPMKNIKDVSRNDNTLPENIDYSASMERLFPE